MLKNKLNEPFLRVPRSILTDERLTDNARLVFGEIYGIVLANHRRGDYGFIVSNEGLSARLNISVASCKRAIKSLADLNYLRSERYWHGRQIVLNKNMLVADDTFIMIPYTIAHDGRLTAKSKLVYGEIYSMLSKKNICFLSDATMSSRLNCSITAVKRALNLLEKCGYIKRLTSFDRKKGKRCRTIQLLKVKAQNPTFTQGEEGSKKQDARRDDSKNKVNEKSQDTNNFNLQKVKAQKRANHKAQKRAFTQEHLSRQKKQENTGVRRAESTNSDIHLQKVKAQKRANNIETNINIETNNIENIHHPKKSGDEFVSFNDNSWLEDRYCDEPLIGEIIETLNEHYNHNWDADNTSNIISLGAVIDDKGFNSDDLSTFSIWLNNSKNSIKSKYGRIPSPATIVREYIKQGRLPF